MSRSNYLGRYIPINPQKYRGDIDNIIYRSSYEFAFMRYLDNHPGVIEWASEPFGIPYYCVVRKNTHRYYPDFLIRKVGKDDKTEILMVEIKPDFETRPPVIKEGKATAKARKRLLRETTTYLINTCKWDAAKKYCKSQGWEFKILTEHDLGIANARKSK